MNRKDKFSWSIFLGSMLAICLLCCGGLSLPLYVFPQVSESQAEELRQDADRILNQAKSESGEDVYSQEIPPGRRPASVVSLHPTRVEIYRNELHIDFDSFVGLSRGIVILPEGADEPKRCGMFEFHRLHPRVYRFVVWPD